MIYQAKCVAAQQVAAAAFLLPAKLCRLTHARREERLQARLIMYSNCSVADDHMDIQLEGGGNAYLRDECLRVSCRREGWSWGGELVATYLCTCAEKPSSGQVTLVDGSAFGAG